MPLSRLEAVNMMLSAVGESVILVEVEGAGDFANCSAILDAATKAVLAKDYDFNTEVRTLVPDANGNLLVGPEVLKIDPVDPYLKVVQRGTKLYNKADRTDVFTDSLDVNVTLYFPFEECPYHVQQRIVADATAKYQTSYVGSVAADNFLQRDRGEAIADSQASESDVDDYNMLDNPDLAFLRRRTYPNGSIL
ncbi:hypothetical protein [Cupriavidus taiwanensis]|uniref:hypothetical protein n=1 Tax=Cupriavidus taiwanensis TaxID=164546 RepID=UPI000E10A8A3|nr:hypothetical protein [Cupriavidus taiwanensis]SPA50604.1 putative Tail tubular protein A [Cupriavidus taiwanensis]